MKKLLLIVTLFVLSISSVFAEVTSMTIELKDREIGLNDKTYLSVFVANGVEQVENADIKVVSTPDFPVILGEMNNCASAEWRELCGEMDTQLIWLGWAYVMEIKSKDIDEDVVFTVSVDSKVGKTDLRLGEGRNNEPVLSYSEVPKVGDDKVKGFLPLMLGIILLLGLGSFAIMRNKNS